MGGEGNSVSLMRPHLLILGYGAVGHLVADLALAAGWRVLAVRRTSVDDPRVVGLRGDGADPELHASIARGWGAPDAILLAANPGLRGGGDNRLDRVAALTARRWPDARRVMIGSTAVYADAGGATIGDDGPLARGYRPTRLLAIEDAWLGDPAALVLRAGALAGLARARASARLRSGRMAIRGGSRRALTWVHESDLAAVVWQALRGGLGAGTLNVTADNWPSVASFHRRYASELGWPLAIEDVPGDAPERRVASPGLAARGGPPLRREWWT